MGDRPSLGAQHIWALSRSETAPVHRLTPGAGPRSPSVRQCEPPVHGHGPRQPWPTGTLSRGALMGVYWSRRSDSCFRKNSQGLCRAGAPPAPALPRARRPRGSSSPEKGITACPEWSQPHPAAPEAGPRNPSATEWSLISRDTPTSPSKEGQPPPHSTEPSGCGHVPTASAPQLFWGMCYLPRPGPPRGLTLALRPDAQQPRGPRCGGSGSRGHP